MAPKISVALCTYNGERYLRQQLDSIALQTLPPDEIIICDDGSTDSTPEIVKQYQEEVSFKVEWHSNGTKLGTTKNFEKAVHLCTGDYIFLCDQDDYWLPNKIELLVGFLNKNQAADVVFTDALLVDKNLVSSGRTLFGELRFLEEQKQLWRSGNALDVLIQGNRVTGCTVAFRKEFVQRILPFPVDLAAMNFIHDTWIAWASALENRIDFLEEQTVLYRQHENQQIGASAKNSPERLRFVDRLSRSHQEKTNHYRIQEAYFSKILNMLKKYPLTNLNDFKKIERAREYFYTRGNMPVNRISRIKPVMKNLLSGNYHHFVNADASWYTPYLTFFGDLIE